MTTTIYFASFLGDNAFEFYRQAVAYLGQAAGLPTEMVSGLSPDEQERRVNSGEIQAVFTCGLPYVRKAGRQPPLLCLLAAPVMAGPRYENKPVYFSDVIVRADSPYASFDDLRGATCAYNEIYSLSGYMLLCYHLLRRGETGRFFGRTVRAGSHAAAMDWVEQGRAHAAAIDSVVLAMELAQRPERAATFRVAQSIGPAPMPPVAASPKLAPKIRRRLAEALLAMDTTPHGQAILKAGGMSRFAPVVDADYNPIRQMITALQQAKIYELR